MGLLEAYGASISASFLNLATISCDAYKKNKMRSKKHDNAVLKANCNESTNNVNNTKLKARRRGATVMKHGFNKLK